MARKHSSKSGVAFTNREWSIYRFLFMHSIGVLSTVTPDGDPHGAVIYYSIDRSFTISFLTKDRTRKFDNISHNNRVMLTVYDPATLTTVQVTGIATQITDNAEVNAVANSVLRACLATSITGTPPLTKLQAGDYVACTIKSLLIRKAVYAQAASGSYAELFESIESFDLDLT